VSARARLPRAWTNRHIGIGLTTGVLTGLLAVVSSMTATLFVFSGALQASFPVGLAMSLVSSIVFAAASAATRSKSFAIMRPQEVAIANLGVTALALRAAMEGAPYARIEATVVALCVLGTASVGLGLWTIGRFSLTRYLRFVPYCVISGYLASVGFLLFKSGAYSLAGAEKLHGFEQAFATPDSLLRLGAGLVFALCLLIVERRSSSRLATPLLILAAIVAFQIVVHALGLSPETLREHGWILASKPKGFHDLAPLSVDRLSEIDFRAIAAQAPSLVFLVLISGLGEMLAIAGIGRASVDDHSVDLEFKTAGATNLLVALLGGMPGYHSTSHTLLALRFAAPIRLVAAMSALVCLATLVVGEPLLTAMPWPLFGAMLIWSGLAGLQDWFFKGLFESKPADAIVKTLILVVVAAVGFYQGMIFGALAGSFLFMVEYARTGVVRLQLSGRDYHSSLTQFDDARRRALAEVGDAISMLRLKGYVFFGSAHGLRERIEQMLAQDPRIEFVIVDFAEVAGVDGAAAMALESVGRKARRASVAIVLCAFPDAPRRALESLGLDLAANFLFARSLDEGLRVAEDVVLRRQAPETVSLAPISLLAWLREATGSEAVAASLAEGGETLDFAEGEIVIAEGAQSDELYLLVEGEAAVETIAVGGGRVQLATMGPGALFGELAYLLRTPRAATVRAKTALRVWRISRDALDALAQHDAPAALVFQTALSTRLADRVLSANRLVRFLSQ